MWKIVPHDTYSRQKARNRQGNNLLQKVLSNQLTVNDLGQVVIYFLIVQKY